MLESIIQAGVDVVRLNFFHGEPEVHARSAALVREIAHRLGCNVAILGVLQRPNIRIARL
jgi:pyruvate kinase